MYWVRRSVTLSSGRWDGATSLLKGLMCSSHRHGRSTPGAMCVRISRLRDQPSYDTVDRICPACEETDSIESVHHVLLHCPEYEHIRTVLRDTISLLPAAQAFPRVLVDEDAMIALLRDDFRGGGRGDSYCSEHISTPRHHIYEPLGGAIRGMTVGEH